MKYILILMFYVPQSQAIHAVTTAEFDDAAACESAYTQMADMMLTRNPKYSVAFKCVPKGTAKGGK